VKSKIAWQSFVVSALGLGAYAIGLIAGNESTLGINSPWLTIVIIPTTLTAFVIAANQLKAIGSDTPYAPPSQPQKPPQ
jgi:hypothetical protein